ncbi:MAG: avidin/streptavidin family protein [Gammaproteobacteria bacterium]|nr:avidin/streptavidin family protein [Gammaproteobacteria bacterium]
MDINGSWINQNGSTVTFEEDRKGVVKGEFRSRKGRAAADKGYALTGMQNGELLAFQVDWRDDEVNLHSMASFACRLAVDGDGRDTIHAMWVLARQFEDEALSKPTQVWNTFMTNVDIFVREDAR